jgi:hypothetical protein
MFVVSFSGRDLCDGLITRPEESYRLCCVNVCDLETSRMRRLKPASGLLKPVKEEEEGEVAWHIHKHCLNLRKNRVSTNNFDRFHSYKNKNFHL